MKKHFNAFYRLVRKFSAAHHLPGYDGACAGIHGHTWKVEIGIRYVGALDEVGIGIDFKELKKLIDDALPDHRFLNDIELHPTAEILAPILVERIDEALGDHFDHGSADRFAVVEELTLWESENAAVFVGKDQCSEIMLRVRGEIE